VALTITPRDCCRGHALSIGSTQSLAVTRALVREADVCLQSAPN